MKKLRNINCLILLIFSIVITLGSFNFAKAEENFSVTIDNVTGNPGAEVIVPIRFNNVPAQGINNCNFNLQFDSNLLEIQDVTPGTLVVNPDKDFGFNKYDAINVDDEAIEVNQIQFFFCDESEDYSRAIKEDGVFANIKFRIKSAGNDQIGQVDITAPISDAPYGNSTSVDKRGSVFGINGANNSIDNVHPILSAGNVTIKATAGSKDLENLQADEAAITFGAITGDITLPSTGDHGSTITWSSSNTAVIGNDGKVNRPLAGQPDVAVTLTATFVNGTARDQKDFNVVVLTQSKDVNDNDFVSIIGESTVEANKDWVINFKAPVNIESLNNSNIFVLDENNRLVAVTLSINPANSKQVIVGNNGLYQSGHTYRLYITKDLKSRKGRNLKRAIIVKFTIK